MPVTLSRLNHAVLYVRDLGRSLAFYQQVFAFDVIQRMGDNAAFLRATGGTNHHDLGLFAVGKDAPLPQPGVAGLYHLAWEVPTLEDLARVREVLAGLGALGGQSDHGASKSLYARDPDGIEFEVMWAVPPEEWGEFDRQAVVRPLHLDREIAARGGGAV